MDGSGVDAPSDQQELARGHGSGVLDPAILARRDRKFGRPVNADRRCRIGQLFNRQQEMSRAKIAGHIMLANWPAWNDGALDWS